MKKLIILSMLCMLIIGQASAEQSSTATTSHQMVGGKGGIRREPTAEEMAAFDAETRAYWTPERIAAATPAPMPPAL